MDFAGSKCSIVLRIFRRDNGPAGVLAKFQYFSDAVKWADMLSYDRDYFHAVIAPDGETMTFGVVEKKGIAA